MRVSQAKIRHIWRTKYPWIIAFYIFMFGILTGVLKMNDGQGVFNLDIYMIAVFTSLVFLYVFYIFGVRPIELEHHFKRK